MSFSRHIVFSAMTVEKLDVVDILTRNPKTNEVMLVMVEVRDWNAVPEALGQLHGKFRLYAEYVLSGALARQYSDLAHRAVVIRLDHFRPIPDAVAGVLRQWATRLAGIQVGVCSHRRYWNPVLNFLRRLRSRFSGGDRDVIRWEPGPGSDTALSSLAEFTEEFTAALRQAMPTLQVEVVRDLELKLISPSGTQSQCFLHNAYSQHLLAPDRKSLDIQKRVAGIVETERGQEGPPDKARIVPVLKDRTWLGEANVHLQARGSEKPMDVVHEAYNEELVIVYAEDTPKTVRYLTSDNLAALKMERTALRPLAWANLKRLVGEPDIRQEDGLYRVRAGGDYDACILLLDDFWDTANIPVAGGLVAAVPARDFLAVTGSQEAQDVARLRQVAQGVAAQAPYRLTPKVFVRRHGRFVVYEG
jgi:uncharacterized protein YtpQ (UPF0354 family)